MNGCKKTGLVALFHKFDVVFESFLFFKIRAISWKICVKTCGDIFMIKIVIKIFYRKETKCPLGLKRMEIVFDKSICVNFNTYATNSGSDFCLN